MTVDEQYIDHYLRVYHHDGGGTLQLRDCYKAMLKTLRARIAKDRELVIQTAAALASGSGAPLRLDSAQVALAVKKARAIIAAVDEPVEALPIDCDRGGECFHAHPVNTPNMMRST